jgi:DNA-binding transcriptional LysR family regulator
VPGDIQIRQLEYLVALAREQHFGRAAAACHASQPALSAAIRKLETELGVPIARRGQRFSGFTPEGEEVVRWAHRILAERDALRTDLDRMRGGLTATLRIGAIPTAVPVTPLLTEPFSAHHPLAHVTIEVLAAREITRRLEEFDLDVGLTYLEEPVAAPSDGYPLYRERYLLLTPTDGPLAGQRTADWASAASLPLCTLNSTMHNRRILDRAAAQAGARLAPVVETDTVDALYAHLSSRRWSSIIAHTWLRAFGVPHGMRVVPLTAPSPSPVVGVVTAHSHPRSLVVEALIETIGAIDIAAALETYLDTSTE